MSEAQSRVLPGIPRGGQFAAAQRPEAGLGLAPRPGQVPQVRRAQGDGQTNRLGLGSVTFTRHFLDQAKAKGFTADQIRGAIEEPEKVTDVTRYPGQRRYCGSGIAVVIDADTGSAITTYLDQVRTPLRADQMNDPAALASARLNGHTYAASH